MKPLRLLILAAFALLAWPLYAADSTPATAAAAAPVSWPQVIIPILTPLIIAGVKLIVPRIPSMWLPILAPMLGALLDYVAHLSMGSALNPLAGVALGAAGVGLREVVDQVKRNMKVTTLMPLVAVAVCLLSLGLGGCMSLETRIDRALPEGKAKHVSATITGKFSSTQVEAVNFSKTKKKVSAERMHFRHSNAWVPLIEGEIEGYERVRRPELPETTENK